MYLFVMQALEFFTDNIMINTIIYYGTAEGGRELLITSITLLTQKIYNKISVNVINNIHHLPWVARYGRKNFIVDLK